MPIYMSLDDLKKVLEASSSMALRQVPMEVRDGRGGGLVIRIEAETAAERAVCAAVRHAGAPLVTTEDGDD